MRRQAVRVRPGPPDEVALCALHGVQLDVSQNYLTGTAKIHNFLVVGVWWLDIGAFIHGEPPYTNY